MTCDGFGDLVGGGPASRSGRLKTCAEEPLSPVLRRVDRKQVVERLGSRSGKAFLVVPEEALDLSLDHHLVVLAAADADVRVARAPCRGGPRRALVRDVCADLA